jgi:ABC-type uncharacterized transport system permease subunit
MAALAYLVIGLYGVTSLIFFGYLFTRDERVSRAGRVTAAMVLVSHFATIGSYCVQGQHPLLGFPTLLNMSAFILVLAYLVFSMKWRLGVAGAVILPLAFALVVSGQLAPHGPPAGGVPMMLGKLHLTLVALGIAALALAAAVAVAYLRQDRALRRNQLAILDRKGPALTTLDTLSLRLTLVGFPLFLLAVVTGILWAARMPNMGSPRIEHFLSGGILVIFLALVVSRLTVGMRGRKAAWLTISGFVVTAVVLTIYMMRRMVG